MRNKFLYASLLFFLLLTVFSMRIPFFWDGTFFSEIALNYFNKGFNHLISPQQPDTGGFPMYSIYMAVGWKIFGKTIAVSHFILFPFLLGICVEYFSLAKRFLNTTALIGASFLLLIAEPVFITQSILMGYDLFLVYFFLLAINTLLQRKHFLFSFALVLLCLCSMRGILCAVSVLIIAVIYSEKNYLSLLKYFIPAA